ASQIHRGHWRPLLHDTVSTTGHCWRSLALARARSSASRHRKLLANTSRRQQHLPAEFKGTRQHVSTKQWPARSRRANFEAAPAAESQTKVSEPADLVRHSESPDSIFGHFLRLRT